MHRNAPLTPQGRFRLCQMIEEGWTIASSAESMRISRQTTHKWWRRYQEAGMAGLEDRSSKATPLPEQGTAEDRAASRSPPSAPSAWTGPSSAASWDPGVDAAPDFAASRGESAL
jgi:transposase-like protein